jgi:sterol desaturase/sphingolipid hydroxylase (fatty acid hydroxylase superfamily)
MILERIIPDQKLETSPHWWTRVILLNTLQAGVVWVAGYTWDEYFDRVSLLDSHFASPPVQGFVAYLLITFIFYWWHRWRHRNYFLWNVFHQIHHSPVRIETITSFYKNPLEICMNSIIIGLTVYYLLGFDRETANWLTLYTSVAEYFYHMNVKTPHWVGYVFQRPEMHRIHHQRGKHDHNFADLPVWDMLFGTFKNPLTSNGACGFAPPREQQLLRMLLARNVNSMKVRK